MKTGLTYTSTVVVSKENVAEYRISYKSIFPHSSFTLSSKSQKMYNRNTNSHFNCLPQKS